MAQKLDRAEFGPNTWLIDEMHRAYLDNPTSVGDAWQEFFADYQPRTRLSEAPSTTPAQRSPTPVPERIPIPADLVPNGEPPAQDIALRGPPAVHAERMAASIAVPTATS